MKKCLALKNVESKQRFSGQDKKDTEVMKPPCPNSL